MGALLNVRSTALLLPGLTDNLTMERIEDSITLSGSLAQASRQPKGAASQK